MRCPRPLEGRLPQRNLKASQEDLWRKGASEP